MRVISYERFRSMGGSDEVWRSLPDVEEEMRKLNLYEDHLFGDCNYCKYNNTDACDKPCNECTEENDQFVFFGEK